MADNSYPKNLRLLSAHDFSNLKVDSKIFKKPSMRIYFKSNNTSFSRLGISISSKSTTAVFRNRIKRKIREEFRKSDFKSTGIDFLCVIHNPPKDFDLKRVEINIVKTVKDFFSGNYV